MRSRVVVAVVTVVWAGGGGGGARGGRLLCKLLYEYFGFDARQAQGVRQQRKGAACPQAVHCRPGKAGHNRAMGGWRHPPDRQPPCAAGCQSAENPASTAAPVPTAGPARTLPGLSRVQRRAAAATGSGGWRQRPQRWRWCLKGLRLQAHQLHAVVRISKRVFKGSVSDLQRKGGRERSTSTTTAHSGGTVFVQLTHRLRLLLLQRAPCNTSKNSWCALRGRKEPLSTARRDKSARRPNQRRDGRHRHARPRKTIDQ